METRRNLLLAVVLGFSSLLFSSPTWSGHWEATVNLQKANAMMANSMYQGLTAFYYSDVYDYTSTGNLYYAWYFADQAKNYAWWALSGRPERHPGADVCLLCLVVRQEYRHLPLQCVHKPQRQQQHIERER